MRSLFNKNYFEQYSQQPQSLHDSLHFLETHRSKTCHFHGLASHFEEV